MTSGRLVPRSHRHHHSNKTGLSVERKNKKQRPQHRHHACGTKITPGTTKVAPHTLLGKPWFECSNMDGVIVTTATANNYVMIYGDVRAGFVIVDRIGSTLELIPNILGSNQRPTGQRGALLWFRTGSEVVNTAVLRLLDVPTTA